MSIRKRKTAWIVALALMVVTLATSLSVGTVATVNADDHFLHDEQVTLSNGNTYTVRALDEGYSNNLYVSLRDMAAVLANTESAFSVNIGDSGIEIMLGENGDTDRSLNGWSEDERNAYYGKSLGMNDLTVNGEDRKYYTIRASYQGGTDCFMSMLNLMMILDVNAYATGKNAISVNPGEKMVVSPLDLENEGFFLELNGALVGDATTGEIFFQHDADKVFPIASTTKLMTCLLTAEAMANGSISADTMVTISDESERISKSADGAIQMKAGQQATVSELMIGALLPSSNECALALGEAVGGTEADFVQMMNDKARELSMDTAVFYNTNGLPSYGESGLPGKRQNLMSAEDMFKMSSYILNNYPQMKDITSMTFASLPSFGRDVKNTNALLYNMPEINGMKTGTTTKAGACLVTSLTVSDGITDHDIVVVVLGAEGSKARFTISELLARYGKKVVQGELSAEGVVLNSSAGSSSDEGETVQKAITARELVKLVVSGAKKL